MSNIKSGIVQIVQSDKWLDLSKGRKLFNKLIKQINANRKELADWQEVIPAYQQKHFSEFLPLVEKLNGFKEELIYLLDGFYKDSKFSRNERLKIADFICSMSADLMSDKENEKLKQVYNKYSNSDFELEKDEVQDGLKSMLKGALGIDIESNMDINSPEAFFEEMAQKMQQKFDQENAKRFSSKKSPKALIKEAAQKQEEREISQSIKAVYRELVISLHPDKERDEVERQRKTVLMQRINVAYKNKDLLTLLELQLEVEQIDQSTINAMAEKRIEHYNAVLTTQVSELKREISGIKHMFKLRFHTLLVKLPSPKRIIEGLNTDIYILNRDIKEAAMDLIAFKDIKNIKSFLKSYKLQQQDNFMPNGMYKFFTNQEEIIYRNKY